MARIEIKVRVIKESKKYPFLKKGDVVSYSYEVYDEDTEIKVAIFDDNNIENVETKKLILPKGSFKHNSYTYIKCKNNSIIQFEDNPSEYFEKVM